MYRYYVLFTDDFTHFSWIFPMRLKSEVFHHFSTFVSYVETQFSLPVKQFQSDGGKEFDNGLFKTILCFQRHHSPLFLSTYPPNKMA